MEATRNKLAEAERSKGDAEAFGIRAEANTLADKLSAFATQRAEEIKAGANRQTEVYLKEMSEDEGLAIFLLWLDTLKDALKQDVTVILTDDSAPWHLMNVGKLPETKDIPQPRDTYVAGSGQ